MDSQDNSCCCCLRHGGMGDFFGCLICESKDTSCCECDGFMNGFQNEKKIFF